MLTTLSAAYQTCLKLSSKCLALIFSITCLLLPEHAFSQVAGDSILHLGQTGYAALDDGNVKDLDYTKSFSVEGLIKIDPYTTGTRHDSILQKGAKDVIWREASAGFSLGIIENQYETFGKKIQAKVGDGTNHATVRSNFYEGYVYAVITWDAAAKTLVLYMNGSETASNSNPNISLPNIATNAPLQIGKGEGPLKRDVFTVRLWNRKLSSNEVSQLWNHYHTTELHTLPAGFDTTELKSEWLMHYTSNANGNPGTTHLKDTSGTNHLELIDGATVYRGVGALKLNYPANQATDINKAVTLRAQGGAETLDGPVIRPLHYYFQVDQNNSFTSQHLRESGWLAHYSQWQPLLKPDTIYYWRVKVRDSSSTPKESLYSPVNSFTTEGSTNWYVRPQGTSNGSGNGSSYRNAWSSIRNIVWGEQGLEAGDHLYICGIHNYKKGSISYAGNDTLEYIVIAL